MSRVSDDGGPPKWLGCLLIITPVFWAVIICLILYWLR